MGENSKISWTDHTFNPWIGCTKVGPGCDNCYAEAFATRVKLAEWGAGKPRRRVATETWELPLRWEKKAQRRGERARVFCASFADVFDNEVPCEWRDHLWALIRATPTLDWILVTKRIGNVAGMLPPDWGAGYANVWLLITVVTQAEADRDIPKLLDTPAGVRGLSIEPQLEHIELDCVPRPRGWARPMDDISDGIDPLRFPRAQLDWVICGCESGARRRPFDTAWAVSLRDQCARAGVPFFYKQGPGGPAPKHTIETPYIGGRRYMEWPKSRIATVPDPRTGLRAPGAGYEVL